MNKDRIITLICLKCFPLKRDLAKISMPIEKYSTTKEYKCFYCSANLTREEKKKWKVRYLKQ